MRIGIVGGGISGLAVCHYLTKAGLDAVVYEANGRPGGVIHTELKDDRVLDVGPQRTRKTRVLSELIEAIGVSDELIEGAEEPLYVYHNGSLRQVPRSVSDAISTDLLSWRGKLRALGEPVADLPRPGESVHHYFTRAFGSEVARYLAGPLFAGLYAGDPHEMPVDYTLCRAIERFDIDRSLLLAAVSAVLTGHDPPPMVSFERGMATLPKALAKHHDSSIHLETPVRGIQHSESGYVLETAAGSDRVDEVVITTPAPVTARLLQTVAPEASSILRQLTYNPLAIVHLAAREMPAGIGVQVALNEAVSTRGITWNGRLFDRDGINTAFIGGATHPRAVEWPKGRLKDVAAREFESITGSEATAVSVHRRPDAMPAYDSTWNEMAHMELPDGLHLCANYVGRAGITGRLSQAKRIADQLNSDEETGSSQPFAD